jgi:hypothetical protein
LDQFTTFDIAKILGIKRSSLQQWIDFRFVEPSIARAEGRGTKNLFSAEDVFRIAVFRELYSAGLSQKYAGSAARKLPIVMVGAGDGMAYIERKEGKMVLRFAVPKSERPNDFSVRTFINLPKIKEKVETLIRAYQKGKE